MSEREYIVEFIAMGRLVKVIAIDPETGREVSVIGAASAGQAALGKLAARKLEYVLAKDQISRDKGQ